MVYFTGELRLSIGSAFLERQNLYPTGAYPIDMENIEKKQETFRTLLYNQITNMMRSNRMGHLSVLTDAADIIDIQHGSKANVHLWVCLKIKIRDGPFDIQGGTGIFLRGKLFFLFLFVT